MFAASFFVSEERIDQTPSAIWPEGYELVFGSIATVLIFALLWWKAGPFVKKAMAARTARIQGELDSATSALAGAEVESAQIRRALGDIAAERSRILAEADVQAEALVVDGRARLEVEIAEMYTKADADIAAVMSRGSDEMRADIARLASAAADRVVERTIDAETQQRLVEEFISRVGAGVTT
jgi:F-type H+-transporting ATPase subunit b